MNVLSSIFTSFGMDTIFSSVKFVNHRVLLKDKSLPVTLKNTFLTDVFESSVCDMEFPTDIQLFLDSSKPPKDTPVKLSPTLPTISSTLVLSIAEPSKSRLTKATHLG